MSDNIPFEIQLEIIKRVPDVKYLKPWRSFNDTSEFIASYGARDTQPQSLLLRYKDNSNEEKSPPILLHYQDLEKLESMEVAQKVKIKWSIAGDENSKYYHGLLNKSKNQLSIRGVLSDGAWVESPVVVKNEFLTHFRDRFERPKASRLVLDTDFPLKLDSDQKEDLERMVSKEEIKSAVWDCDGIISDDFDKSSALKQKEEDGFKTCLPSSIGRSRNGRSHKAILDGLLLSSAKDRWSWSIDGSEEFYVASTRRLLDDHLLQREIFGAREKKPKDRSIGDIYDGTTRRFLSYEDWMNWLSKVLSPKIIREQLGRRQSEALLHSFGCVRSVEVIAIKLFGTSLPLKANLFDEIVNRSFYWCKYRSKASFSWVDWLKNPSLISL
ncbi:hypothetical protein Tco_0832374 [Tanacetum coccineum]